MNTLAEFGSIENIESIAKDFLFDLQSSKAPLTTRVN
jgi:hypothetical protein